MIEIQIRGGNDAPALAELIASTVAGQASADPRSSVEQVALLVREQQELAERTRPSRDNLATVNFAKLDDDNDWTEL